MNMTLATAILLMPFIGVHTQPTDPETSVAVIPNGSNPVLTAENFNRIQQFILNWGNRETYCSMFNNNPHWAFQDFDAYLNPPNQRNINCEIGKSPFPVLVVRVSRNGPNRYWHIALDEKKGLRVEQHYVRTDPATLTRQAKEFFQKALAEITQRTESQETRVAWVARCLADFQAIKPGMTRAQIEKRLLKDGGLFTFENIRYGHPECRYFKIKVKFLVQRNLVAGQYRSTPSPEDEVIEVSTPYIEQPYMD